jgi:solute carrier family 25 S-adenosylmethionine transporter 26
MASLDWDDIDIWEFQEFPAIEADKIANFSTRKARSDRQIPRRMTTIRRRQFPHKNSQRRATTTLGSALLLLILMVSRVSTTSSFVEASTLPFGTIATSRPQTTAVRDKKPAPSALAHHRNIFETRAGSSSTATFIGPASAGLGLEPLSYYLRVALAGGVAGATGSAVLYPIDSAKTLRQSDPNAYSSVRDALFQMLRSKHSIQRVYKGILPAALGAIPSSALYFGAYESSKVALQKLMGVDLTEKASEHGYRKRLLVHGLAAASGNVISSFVFVPKEVIKQQLQIRGVAKTTIHSIIKEKGLSGLYAGYGATLLRNIPSATIRFVLYEELKRKWATDNDANSGGSSKNRKLRAAGTCLAGAVAGSTSSFVMTPIDVVKTRIATGSCPLGVKNCMLHVIKEVGWKGLYAGAGSRVLWSGAFSAIGFGTFELVKGRLGVASSTSLEMKENSSSRGTLRPTTAKTLSKAATATRCR